MNNYYRNRHLKDREQQFRNKKRCIFCGVKVPVTEHKKKNEDGKYVITKVTWPFECKDCRISSSNNLYHDHGAQWGVGPFSQTHAYKRRMGYRQEDTD